MHIDDENIRTAFRQLQLEGYFNDESSGLGAHVVENRLSEVEVLMRDLGYEGPALKTYAQMYDHGAVYSAYDSSRLSYEDAKSRTERWVRQNSQ